MTLVKLGKKNTDIVRQSVCWNKKVLGQEKILGSTPNTAWRQNGSQRMGNESRDLREFWINGPNWFL